ncbi:MAG: hypothetical protein AAGI63_18870 [Planctomycetota bacterium]
MRHSRCRRGSFLMEAAVAMALLGTALVAATRLARMSAQLNLHSEQRTAAHLAGLNTLERIRALPDDGWMNQADEVADDVSEMTGCQVEVTLEPMNSPPGQHVMVNVAANERVRIALHDWRPNSGDSLNDTTEANELDESESDESESDGQTVDDAASSESTDPPGDGR